MSKEYDVAIVGGGITGASAMYVLDKYTSVDSISLFEKHGRLAQGASNRVNNSQTLHFGDIETNYSVEKAAKVKEAAEMVVRYVHDHEDTDLYSRDHKMVLAVGEEEVARLERRFEKFKELFPDLRKAGREELKELEPNVVQERREGTELLALVSEDGYRMNYGRLARSFVEQTDHGDVYKDTTVERVERKGDGFTVKTAGKNYTARTLLVAAGAYSLEFAHQLGYGENLMILPVAGNFFTANDMVNGKVYMMQDPKLPFAAIHADPDVHEPGETRFGPVSKVLPMLELGNPSSVLDFFRLFGARLDAVLTILNILRDPTYLRYVLMQTLYGVPLVGKYFYLREARKIIPSIQYSDLTVRNDLGGIRPQVANTEEKQMLMGEAKIVRDNAIFDITPSPGASVCLKNAERNAKQLIDCLPGHSFHQEAFDDDFKS